MNFDKYNAFIDEQKKYYEENIKPNFKWLWSDSEWAGGIIGSGWLLSRSGKIHFSFQTGKRMKGIENFSINMRYQEFIKAMMVLSYRKANSKTSPQKLYAEVLILKRWYCELYKTYSEDVHPCYLSTLILTNSFEILAKNSSKSNLPDHAGTYLRLQEMLNHYAFTNNPLEFSKKYLYINTRNRTPNAKRTKALIDQLELDEDELEKDKLISIRTFINIASLINLCERNSEKVILNLLLLLIVTGLRSTEVILLKTDALIKKPLLDPITKAHLTLDGIKQYTLGIQYHGAKGAGYRVHWVEPLAAKLVETIFQSVLELTKESREHLLYIRSKNCSDFLPKVIDEIEDDYVELDNLAGSIFNIGIHKNTRIHLTIAAKHIPIFKQNKLEKYNRIDKFYLKKDINIFIKNLANYDSEFPIEHVFNYEGKVEKIAFEDLLFIHEFKSTSLKRDFSFKANILPFQTTNINNFLGMSPQLSIFQKYNLLENEKEYSKLGSHIPRHNINTFLALSGLSEHLQAMLMGRVDIKQNQYYQHLALKHRKVTASIFGNNELELYNEAADKGNLEYPINGIKNDGLMYFTNQLDLENNLKMNLQTFDSKNEVACYIKNSFFDEFFNDIAKSFNELVKEDHSLADCLVQRHAQLHPLPFGACMREVAVHDCPKRLACQSGDQCGNFALTNRKGELDALQHTLNKLLDEFTHLEKILAHDLSYKEMLENLRQKILYLDELKRKALDRNNKLSPISIFPYDSNITKLPSTLSELFAIEQQKIESKGI